MDNYSIKLPRVQPDSVYTAVITKDGELTLPEGCLTDKTESGNRSDSIVITNSLEDGIIWLYTLDAFDEVCANLAKLNSIDINARNIKRRIIGGAVTVSIDEKRHIRVTSEYMAKLGFVTIQDNANDQNDFPIMILKYHNRIEITSIDAYKTITEELQKQQQEE